MMVWFSRIWYAVAVMMLPSPNKDFSSIPAVTVSLLIKCQNQVIWCKLKSQDAASQLAGSKLISGVIVAYFPYKSDRFQIIWTGWKVRRKKIRSVCVSDSNLARRRYILTGFQFFIRLLGVCGMFLHFEP